MSFRSPLHCLKWSRAGRAFEGGNVLQVLNCIRNVDGQQLARQTPERFASILTRAFARLPDDRTITMREIADELTAWSSRTITT